MTDRPTPETDAAWNNLLNSSIGPGIYNKNEWGRAGVMADVARQLERDRDALRELLQRFLSATDTGMSELSGRIKWFDRIFVIRELARAELAAKESQ